jgi:S-adenosylmethionine synthetase
LKGHDFSVYGHFGRTEPEFTWESIDKAAILAEQAGVLAATR